LKNKFQPPVITSYIAEDNKFLFTLVSYLTVATIIINLNTVHSALIGTAAFLTFFLINGTFLAYSLFEKEQSFPKFMLGILLLVVLIGLVGWLIMITYNLDIIRTAIALLTVTTIASSINRIKLKNRQKPKPPKSTNQIKTSLLLYPVRIIYLSLIGLVFLLLFISRRGEIYTVWGTTHPMFLPALFFSTFLLLVIIFSKEETQYKLLFVILHSILIHSFIIIIFPAGNFGVQQEILGRTRLVFDNIIPNGIGGSVPSILQKLYYLFRGDNFQTAFSVLFARMLSVDVYWTHLPLVPLLWGIFTPLIAYMLSKTLGLQENISILCSLIISLFPTSIIWSYASIPNGLGYLYFFAFTYFLLKYFQFGNAKDLALVLILLISSTLSHYLAGTVALSLLILAYSVKTYINEKEKSLVSAKLSLIISFVFCASILPFALAYRRLFYPPANTFFSLHRFRETPLTEMVLPFLLGSYFDFISRHAIITTLIFGIAPLLGLIGMIYALRFRIHKTSSRSLYFSILFLFLAFLLIVANDRTVKFFMIRVPFVEADRLWVFRDLITTPFTALLIGESFSFTLNKVVKNSFFSFSRSKVINLGFFLVYFLAFIILSGWITYSVYYAYPHYGPLQTTIYEMEAVKYIDETTNERYIVIGDQWILLAGQMFVGIKNPNAFYFSHVDPRGISLFIQAKTNPSNETLMKAMKINNATVAYLIIEKPRLGTGTYNDIINKAQQNNLLTYKTFSYKGEEKIRIFYYKKPSTKSISNAIRDAIT
jgi:hypothetical protein